MAKTSLSPPDLQTQAGRIRWARENAGHSSPRAAAEALGWNENTYKSHEQGIRGKDGIKPRVLEKYARAFNVSPEWLAFGRGGPERQVEDPVELARELLRAMEKRA
jgi:transcriptional regulator with XRE-family HTH domain